MSSDLEGQGATQVLPQVQSPPPGGPPATRNGAGTQPPGGSGGGGRTWLIVLVVVLAALIVGGAIGYFASGMGGAGQGAQVATSTVAPTSTAVAVAPTTPPAPAPAPVTPAAPAAPVVDTTAPKTPKVTFPALNYWLSPDDMKVEIKWSKVTDPSGVSYVLEFAEWLGGGAGWTPETRIDPIKRLYYQREVASFKERYRIIAIDGAGNESAPSPWRFLIEAGSAAEAASLNAAYH